MEQKLAPTDCRALASGRRMQSLGSRTSRVEDESHVSWIEFAALSSPTPRRPVSIFPASAPRRRAIGLEQRV